MSVTGLGRVALAEKMSVDQLKEALNNKTLPAYIAVPLIEEKEALASRMQNMMAMRRMQEQPRTSISEEILARSAPGIDQLPTNLEPAMEMAGGGIVAFEDGGQVIHAYNGIPPERFEAASEAVRRARREQLGLDATGLDDQTQRDREAMLDTLRRMKAAGMDIATLPGRGLAGAFESAITRPLRAAGVPIPYLPSSFYGGDATSMTPYYDQIRRQDEARKAAQPVKPDATIPATATAAPPAPPGGPAAAGQGIVPPAARLPVPPAGSAMAATKAALEGTPGSEVDEGIAGYFKRSEDREKRLMEALGKDRLQGKAFETYEKALQKDAEQAGADKDQAKYMSLLKAGLAMMAGTSRHALENIGRGAMVGAEDYQKAYGDLRKAERERIKELSLIEQARRAEARDDLKRRDDLLMRASEASQKRDDFGTNALLSAGIEDSRAARDIWKTQYSGGVQLQAANIAAASRGRVGITPAQLAGFRERAIKSINPQDIRQQVADQRKIKPPKPGVDTKFDDDVNKAYEKAINDYVQRILGGVQSTAGSLKGFELVPGSE